MDEHPYDGYAETLLTGVALPLADDARTDLEAAHRTIHNLSRADLENVAFILAALVPTGVRLSQLAWWQMSNPDAQYVRILAPCGTRAANKRHRTAGERPCDACTRADRQYQRDRIARRRKQARHGGKTADQVYRRSA